MAVNQTITAFINKAAKDGLARNNLWRVISFDCRGIKLSEDDLLYCKSAQIPGRAIPIATVPYMGMKMPYPQSTVEYPGCEDYALKFYVDADSKFLQALEVASRTEFNDITSTGNWNFPDPHNIITLAGVDNQMEVTEYIKLHGVVYKSHDAIDVQMAEGDGTAIEVTVHVSYLYARRTGSDTVYTGA